MKIYQQNGNVSWRGRAEIKQLAWAMAEMQIWHRKSRLVFSARFPVINWRSRSDAKSGSERSSLVPPQLCESVYHWKGKSEVNIWRGHVGTI